jgi:hypothetical protein
MAIYVFLVDNLCHMVPRFQRIANNIICILLFRISRWYENFKLLEQLNVSIIKFNYIYIKIDFHVISSSSPVAANMMVTEDLHSR